MSMYVRRPHEISSHVVIHPLPFRIYITHESHYYEVTRYFHTHIIYMQVLARTCTGRQLQYNGERLHVHVHVHVHGVSCAYIMQHRR